jgi:hypothetical protein
MSDTDESAWYELRPNGHPSIAVLNPKRYVTQAAAEEAAAEMRRRSPDFKFVEIVGYTFANGQRSRATLVARV